jgi:multiple sugar transport system ATP-binding protein
MSRVSLRRVVKRYGRTEAVRGISFDVEDGELLVVLGPSGCGKTSTLRMIAGLERVTEGEITFDGRRVDTVAPARRNVAMAFENYGLYEHWPVYENIAYPLRLRGRSGPELDRTIRAIAEKLQLTTYLDERPTGLSGGMRQRVGLARALVRDPSVFLLDEPMSHVDADLRNDMRTEIKRIHAEVGATMIIVTHDQLDALAMADRIIVMDDGRIEQHGAPEEVYTTPASAFVAGFIGEPAMNLLPATVTGPGELALDPGGRLALTPRQEARLAGLAAGEPVTVGFRPHVVRILPADAPPPAGPGLVADGEVYMVEPLGDRTLLTVRSGRGPLVKVDLLGRLDAAVGAPVRLAAAADDVRLFDTASGRLLDGGVQPPVGVAEPVP